jgi:hypothetical protein
VKNTALANPDHLRPEWEWVAIGIGMAVGMGIIVASFVGLVFWWYAHGFP